MSDEKKQGIGGGLFGRESSATYEVYLNLTPLMDVMSNILFFLLAAFGASAVAVFAVSVPIDATGDSSDRPPEDKVTVTLRADSMGLTLGCTDPVKTPTELAVCAKSLPKHGNDYDTAGLTAALKEIKAQFPGSESIMVVPDDALHYETVVKLLDAARDIKEPNGKRLLLFPEVILSSLVQ
jgi:biopolymer transport protein ExbD